METTFKTLGIVGEELACQFVKARGYKVLLRNYKCPLGEIDLVAKEKGVLVFMEVKTRRSLEMGLPVESITFHKRAQITKCAKYYLKRYRIADVPCRFDVVSVFLEQDKHPEIELIQNAFCEGT